jgi:predicted methyltransferase
MSGVDSGVRGTPTFFINGVRYTESWDADTLTEALTRAAHSHAKDSPKRHGARNPRGR